MARIVAVHSYRGGTGKSHTVANLAVLLAARGLRVALVDTDVQTPGVHTLFGLQPDNAPLGLSDYLVSDCEIEQATYDLTHLLPAPAGLTGPGPGALYVVPGRARMTTMVQVAAHRYDLALLNAGLQRLRRLLTLDLLLLDTHPGMTGETMLALAAADTVIAVIRPDPQEYDGAEVSRLMTRRMTAARPLVVVNMVPTTVDADEMLLRVLDTYDGDVAAVMPYCSELAGLSGEELFVLRYPEHQVTGLLHLVADGLRVQPGGTTAG